MIFTFGFTKLCNYAYLKLQMKLLIIPINRPPIVYEEEKVEGWQVISEAIIGDKYNANKQLLSSRK